MGRFSLRGTVEDYKSLSVYFLNKNRYFCGYRAGTIWWSNYIGENRGSIAIEVSIYDDFTGSVRFQYTHTDRFSNEKTDLDYTVSLVSTPCNYGGRRWWFVCPLSRNGIYCGRRVGVLHLRGKYFGCRLCHDLTYQSCKDSHKFDRLALSIGTTARMFKSKNGF